MERELIRHANGLAPENATGLEAVLSSQEPQVLNRVINLETGSLAVEAGVKMMLRRFYRLEPTDSEPLYYGKTPVFLVVADYEGGPQANYHGTTVITQTMRGLWPELYQRCADQEIYRVVTVRQNDIDDFREKIERYNSGPYQTAGFLHEIVLMNYGGILLEFGRAHV